MKDISLRACRDTDENELCQATEPVYYELCRQYSKTEIRVVIKDGRIVGWAYLRLPESALYAGFVFVYIVPSIRRQGIGTIVYRRLEAELLSVCDEWWSSYPVSEAADSFALSVGFDYTNTNLYLVHHGMIVEYPSDGIRLCRPEDYPEAPDLWSREYAAMHRRVGLPFETKKRSEAYRKAEFKDFNDHIGNCYVLEAEGRIIGFGQLFDDGAGIGSIAIDHAYAGKGYGTRLAAYMTNACIRRGCENPCLYCEGGNEDALHVYRKIGYAEQSRESVAVKRIQV